MRKLLLTLIVALLPLGAWADERDAGPVLQPAVVTTEMAPIPVVEFLGLSERQLAGVVLGAVAGAVLAALVSSGSVPVIAAVAGGVLGYWWVTSDNPLRTRTIGIDIACAPPGCVPAR